MSQLVAKTGERIEPAKRRPMTKARRLRIYLRDNGRCGECGCKVPMEGTTVDHRISLFSGGSDDDENLRYLCAACDAPKTYEEDAPKHAKIRRLIIKEDPDQRKPSRMQSRGFDKTKSRTFSGKVVERKKR